MAVMVIAGSGSRAGKTAVGCALIAAMPEFRWVAVKVTPHLHAKAEVLPSGAKARIFPEGSMYGLKAVPFAQGNFPEASKGIWEETDRDSDKDTGRYLAAGALRTFLLSDVEDSRAVALVAEARVRAVNCDAVLVESNRILPSDVARYGESMVSLAVLAGSEAEWKPSLFGRIGSVDALVLRYREQLSLDLQQKRSFYLLKDRWSMPELVKFVRERLIDSRCA